MRKLRNASIALAVVCFVLGALTHFLGWTEASPLVPHPLVFLAIGVLLLIKVFLIGLMKPDTPPQQPEDG